MNIRIISKVLLLMAFFFIITGTVRASDEIFHAIATGDIVKIRELLDKDPNMLNTVKSSLTPLLCAVRLERKDIVELLISRGADIHTEYSNGYTPLEYSFKYGYNEIFDLLIKKEAEEFTLHYAAYTGNLKAVILFF
ncbi:MAG: ankyrin repeat domain-containing protein [Candidatus Eremiobacterota bacterium]